jgi:hypothetical protein
MNTNVAETICDRLPGVTKKALKYKLAYMMLTKGNVTESEFFGRFNHYEPSSIKSRLFELKEDLSIERSKTKDPVIGYDVLYTCNGIKRDALKKYIK